MSAIGLSRDEKHRYFWNGDGPIPSVTTILDTLAKPYLVPWAKKIVAQAAVDNIGLLNRMMAQNGPEATVRWLKSLPDTRRDKAADLGTRVHKLAERLALREKVEVTAEEAPFVTSYQRFMAEFQPKFLFVEPLVLNTEYWYAGGADSFAIIDGEVWILDIKTGASIYPTTALQLAAYANAGFIGEAGSAEKIPVPTVRHYGIVHVRPEGAPLVEVNPAGAFDTFLNLLTVYDALPKINKSLGEPQLTRTARN